MAYVPESELLHPGANPQCVRLRPESEVRSPEFPSTTVCRQMAAKSAAIWAMTAADAGKCAVSDFMVCSGCRAEIKIWDSP